MKEADNLQKRTLSMERLLNAPVELVWEAWTTPEHIAKWWGPGGMTTRVIEHDFKVGGRWEFRMDMPGKGEFITEGIYSRIEPHQLIETSADFKPMTEGVILQIHFMPTGDQTELIFKVIHPTEEYCRQQEDMGFYNGWGSVFDGLEKHLSSLR